MSEATLPRAKVSHAQAALALALLLGLQPVTTDLYLPALPLLTRALDAPMSAAQQTMAALILAFGIGQLVCGPLADRIGRRPVLLGGLALYTAAGVAGALAADIAALVAWRALQGLGMAAAIVCARALVRDLYEPQEGAQVMALGLAGLGVLAIGSPALGGALAAVWGWRATLLAVAVIGAAALAYVALALPETAPRLNPRATQVRTLAAAWGRIAVHPGFVAWTALISCTYGGLFTMLAASSFVYIDVLGLAPTRYGLVLGTSSVAYLVGTLFCRRWIRESGLAGTVRRGAVFTLAGGASMVGLWLAGAQSVWAIALPQMLFSFGHGIHQPCGQVGAVGPFPQAAGSAAALAGFVLAATAFLIGLWLGQAMDGTVRPLVLGVGFWSLMTAGVALTLVQRQDRRA